MRQQERECSSAKVRRGSPIGPALTIRGATVSSALDEPATSCSGHNTDLRTAQLRIVSRNSDSSLTAVAGVGPVEIVPEDVAVVEAEVVPGDFGFGEPARLFGVVAADGMGP